MTPNLVLALMFGSLTLFMLSGLPIAFVLGGLSLLFTVTLWEPSAVIVLVLQIFDTMKSEALLAIPLFLVLPRLFGLTGMYLVSAVAMVLWGRHSDLTGERIGHVCAPACLGAVGFLASATVSDPLPSGATLMRDSASRALTTWNAGVVL
mgnify:CR=1 FL=1